MSDPKEIHVAVGLIRDSDGRVLISKRKNNVHQGGLWEFPGGKLEGDEDTLQALTRELKEELGISVVSAAPLIKIEHRYGDRRVLLDVWEIEKFLGIAEGLEDQPICWLSKDELTQYSLPEANYPIVTAIRLPQFYPFLEDPSGELDSMKRTVERMIENGIELFRLRASQLNHAEYRNFSIEICRMAASNGVKVLLNAVPGLVLKANAAGLHLTSQQLMKLKKRPLDRGFWVAASCHNLEEIEHAEAVGVDFIVLSPVLPTPSHAEAQSLGWDEFRYLASIAKFPVFALGGMRKDDLHKAKYYGAQGISGISAFITYDSSLHLPRA